MGAFKSSRFFPVQVTDLAPVAQEVASHFRVQDFEVTAVETLTGWQIDISKGGMFKAVLGMRTAMKIEIDPVSNGVQAKAGIGIWGQQVIPTAITLFLFWPVMITQIWGMVQSSKLDDEAMDVIGRSLAARSSGTSNMASTTTGKFCTGCGQSITPTTKFCPECGAKT